LPQRSLAHHKKIKKLLPAHCFDFNITMPSYSIEYSKSGRAACKNKKCGEKIAIGELRIGATSEGGQGYDVCKWYHVRCFPMPRKHADVEQFVVDILEDVSEDNSILPGKKEEICELLASQLVAKKGGSGDPYIDLLKACMDGEAEEDEDGDDKKNKKKGKRKKSAANDDNEPNKKRVKTDVDPRAVQIYAKIHKMTLFELQDILRWNRQVLKGTKTAVMRKVIDGELNGRLGLCLVCGGKLKMSDNFDKVSYLIGYFPL
jgi:Poly(ADP-ribose) polymerase and DNA-Ligase Zn-finger region